jgi:hypothetical protein
MRFYEGGRALSRCHRALRRPVRGSPGEDETVVVKLVLNVRSARVHWMLPVPPHGQTRRRVGQPRGRRLDRASAQRRQNCPRRESHSSGRASADWAQDPASREWTYGGFTERFLYYTPKGQRNRRRTSCSGRVSAGLVNPYLAQAPTTRQPGGAGRRRRDPGPL